MNQARAYWSGTFQVGVIALPVKMYGTASAHDTKFRLLHRDCGQPISQHRACDGCGIAELGWDQITKGAQISKTQFAPITEDELDDLPLPTAGSIVIEGFLPAGAVPALQREKAVYLGPDEKAARPFALLAHALAVSKKVGIGKVAIRGREHLVAVEGVLALGGLPALVLWQLYFADELRPVNEVPNIEAAWEASATFSGEEMALANSLLDALPVPDDYLTTARDQAEDALAVLIGRKAEGLPAPERSRAPEKVVDLMDALRESLRRAREGSAA